MSKNDDPQIAAASQKLNQAKRFIFDLPVGYALLSTCFGFDRSTNSGSVIQPVRTGLSHSCPSICSRAAAPTYKPAATSGAIRPLGSVRLTEMALNVCASLVAASEAVEGIRIGQVNVTQITAVILGVLPAIINMATGETVRQDIALERRGEQGARWRRPKQVPQREIPDGTRTELREVRLADRVSRTRTKILEILSGIYEDDFEPIREDKPEQPQLPPPEPFREPKSASPAPSSRKLLDGNVKG
ncbi:MAG: hypothetical protein IPK52_13745 [Chloroflexi bacterium]|nr:hypothetical protein [Chloroflexota bacterium]